MDEFNHLLASDIPKFLNFGCRFLNYENRFHEGFQGGFECLLLEMKKGKCLTFTSKINMLIYHLTLPYSNFIPKSKNICPQINLCHTYNLNVT